MATRAPAANRAAAAPKRTAGKTATTKAPTQYIFEWEGKDRKGKIFKGEMRAESITEVNAVLRKQGLSITKSKRRRAARGKKITPKDVAYFTRQLSTMLKAGVPLLQSVDIIAKGHANPNFTQLLTEIRADIESGSSMAAAFRRHPKYFDTLYCNLIDAGEQGGILDALLERLSMYMEKSLALKAQIKSALIYPISVLTVAFAVTVVLMIFVVPSFKGVFSSFGADLPAPTLFVIAISDFFVKWWIPIVLGPVIGIALFTRAFKRSENVQRSTHRFILRIPIFGNIIRKATIARWTRTLATMFAAGTPLVESMDSVAGAAGNWIYHDATLEIQQAVRIGTSLTNAMQATHVFDNMVLQMTQIGEESGALDNMLLKVAEFYEREVDDAVANISTLIEPIIIVFLGVMIGGMVVAMYLPIFKLGTVV
ncbi:type II secretion system F family protein [Ralstonia insidiosa]|jgi:type IV pilus assembly protein PilC|uniref:type II secretion system F family protein n=1 Tax=Ralstonia TaxID=48736 RepID=UPI000664A1E1|nr:type II secretion system F family protein [Ralstonia insidiosa]KMW47485.1 type II secretion system protein F [Ralstonia sp. MD27]MBX3773739.1 type II secretion system F family protein [Ralstonia pickettii]NOZ17007.1 type II secretion system F family protein [Betaproteobacteria bacterium]MBA9857478.1 type II secretion system F family protein [Ralstonia insidiosa]MBA9870808.1 type II secretion system F family protein [Ralstonia insidiosa]